MAGSILVYKITYLLAAAGEEDRKWRHVVNGVVGTSHVTSGAAVTALWSPAVSPSTPAASPASRPGPDDSPLNLTVSRTTSRRPRTSSTPETPRTQTAGAGGGGVVRRDSEEDVADVCSPPPAHNTHCQTDNNRSPRKPSHNSQVDC